MLINLVITDKNLKNDGTISYTFGTTLDIDKLVLKSAQITCNQNIHKNRESSGLFCQFTNLGIIDSVVLANDHDGSAISSINTQKIKNAVLIGNMDDDFRPVFYDYVIAKNPIGLSLSTLDLQLSHYKSITTKTTTWEQLGTDINANYEDILGFDVSISGNGNWIGMVAHWGDASGFGSGELWMREYDAGSSSKWSDRGVIPGIGGGSYLSSVSLSYSGLFLATGQQHHSSNKGAVKCFKWNGSAWVVYGNVFLGETNGDFMGANVEMNYAGDIIAVSSYGFSSSKGKVEVYKINANGTAWVKMGGSIIGEHNNDEFGKGEFGLSHDGYTIALGTDHHSDSVSNKSEVYVYKYDKTNDLWVIKGDSTIIPPVLPTDLEVPAITARINGDGSIVAFNGMLSSSEEVVFIYQYSSITNKWTPLGEIIKNPITSATYFGYGVSISGSGLRIVVGAMLEGSEAGCVYVYDFNGTSWNLMERIHGEDTSSLNHTNRFGMRVSMSDSGERFIGGAYGNDSGGVRGRGQARIFENNRVIKTVKETDFSNTFLHANIVLEAELLPKDENTFNNS